MASELVDLLVNQVVLVSMVLGPLITLYHHPSDSVQVEAVLAPHHSASVLEVQPEALAPPPRVDMKTLISALEASADSPFLAWDREGQVAYSDQALAQASAWEVDRELSDLGLEQVLEATVVPQQAHQV